MVGHCHGTIHVRDQIAGLTGVPSPDIDLFVAGINHFHLVQHAVDRRNGVDLLAALADYPDHVRAWQAQDFTQWKMLHELGYLFGHGIWHDFDYLPYADHRLFRHTERNTWERACLAVQARRRAGLEGLDRRAAAADDAALAAFLAEPEPEQIIPIMHALAGERGPYFYLSGNLSNAGHIPQLPAGAIVELPAQVRRDGIELQPAIAPLPPFRGGMVTHATCDSRTERTGRVGAQPPRRRRGDRVRPQLAATATARRANC